jgi:hypothetical protein
MRRRRVLCGAHDAFEEVSHYCAYAESMVTSCVRSTSTAAARARIMQHAETLSDTILGVEETDLMRRRVAAARALGVFPKRNTYRSGFAFNSSS